MSDQPQPADAGEPRIRITRAEVGERFEIVPDDLMRGRGDYAGLPVDERARLAGFVETVTAPELDEASAVAAGEAYADRVVAGIRAWTPPDPAEVTRTLLECVATARATAAAADRLSGGQERTVPTLLEQCAVAMEQAAQQWRRYVGPFPTLDAAAAAAGEAYAQRHQRADLEPGAFERMRAGIVDAARAGGPGGVPRWKLRNAVLPAGVPSAPFFVALVGALEAGDIERVPGDAPGSRYRVPQTPARSAGLPTPAEMIAAAEAQLDVAYRALGDAGDELRSDWRPGTSLTDEQAGQRSRMFAAITAAKAAINGGRR